MSVCLIPTKERLCKKCQKTKPLSAFKDDQECRYKKGYTCQSCHKAYGRERYSITYWKNPEKFRQQSKDYRKTSRGKYLGKLNRDKWYKRIHNSPEGLYKIYKSSAKKYSRCFKLSLNDFISWFNKTDCYYCGDHINTIGLDRVCNTEGYIKDNIVPCCSICNYMKRNQGQSAFFKHVLKIAHKI